MGTAHRFVAIMATLTCLWGTAPAMAAPPESFAPIIEPLMPAVVNISTTQKVSQPLGPVFDFQGIPGPQNRQIQQFLRQFNEQFGGMGAPRQREVTSLGSGFVIDPEGYVVTNNHVIGNAEKITVIFQNKTHLDATIVGRDEKTDLALLKVKTDKPLVAVKFGNSDEAKVGDWVIAVGNPFGLGGSVSAGIVSARGRNINVGPFDDFIQTDAAINRGNSGGPLFNTQGEVVGVNSAIFSPTGGNIGIGFAVPSLMVKSVVSQLRQYGTIHRGWMGVKIEAVSDELANSLGLGKARGALVSDVTTHGPAATAGLQPGDVILRYNGKDITEMRLLPRYVAETKSGTKVPVIYWRKGNEMATHLTVGKLPESVESEEANGQPHPAVPKGAQVLGMQLVPLSKEVRMQLSLPASSKGVIVEAIDRNGAAAKRGIRRGDVILEVNQMPVDSTAAVEKALASARKIGRDFALVRIARKDEAFFVTVPVK